MTSAPYSGGVGLVLMLALGEAALCGAGEVEPVHFLLGICKACELPPADAELDGEVRELRAAFERAGLDTAAFRRRLRARVARPDRAPRGDGVPPGSAVARELFSRAEELAAAQHAGLMGLPHLLSAVLETPSPPWAALAAEMGVPSLRGSLLPGQPEPAGQPQPGGEQAGDRSARVTLTVLQGPLRDRTFEFHERTTCVVGRADDCTLQLPEDEEYSGISRHHCLLDINPPDVRVRDLGSVNGTYVNGDKIGQRDTGPPPQEADRLPSSERELADGDEIGLGTIRLRVGIRVPLRCATCGRTVSGTEEADAAGHRDAYQCQLCRTTELPSTVGTRQPQRRAERTCAACGGRLGAEHTAQPLAEELCAACKADPERVMRQLLQVAEDGTKNLYLFGGYTVQRQLGQGGMGAVYLARDHQTDELCALKVMLPQAAGSETARARFLREMSTVEMLRHPHLVRLHDHGCWNGIFFFAMDYCDGGDVSGLVHRRGGRLPGYQALGITLQVLDGLSHAHQADVRAYDAAGHPLAVRGLVHRDLSPRNIFLHGGMAKVGDFGLAKAFDAAGLSGLTHTGTTAGSPSFVSRQQVLRFKRAQPEVDVWAAAACLYYMLTGSAPRPHVDRWRVVLDSPAVPIRRRSPDIPERLAKVIDHALTEHPRIGFTTAAEFRQALVEARE
ncbi:protein kinase domain-containing protein [Streptomyces sp. TRM68367]|uniref:protein kinase domain-containing protein n=1 Tax=Streptomyces sp. TRM68367 TaxID=2758415 RepID=UPI001CAA259C|nr:protein kinase [Streptomyces sp. TRM68367]